MSVPVFVSAGAYTGATAASITPALPTSRTNGYLLVAFCRDDGAVSTNTITLSAGSISNGWSIFLSVNQGASRPMVAAWRIVDGSESAPVFDLTADPVTAQVYMYSGVIASPIGATGSNASITGASTLTCPSITTTAPDSLVVQCAINNTATASGVPAGWSSEGSGNYLSALAAYRTADLAVATLGSASGATSETISTANYSVLVFEILSTTPPTVGTLSITQATETLAAAGASLIVGTLSVPQANETLFSTLFVPIVTASFTVADHAMVQTRSAPVIIDRISVHPAPIPFWRAVTALVQGLTVSLAATERFIWGRTLVQSLKIHDALLESAHYHAALSQLFRLAGAPSLGFPLVLHQNLSVHPSSVVTLGLKLLQKFMLTSAQVPVADYHLVSADRMTIKETLLRFIGEVLAQLFTVHAASTRQFTTSGVLAQLLTIHPAFVNKLVLQIVGNLTVSAEQLLQLIYMGDELIDGVVINALYVSPSGTTTAWAVNTRTNAVTEYLNYNFNSFAMMSNRYIAANSSGLYELDGDTDNGAVIIAELCTGYFQLNEKKLFGIKGAYIALRGGGRFFLKLISGDGREYIYELKLQPNLMTTKVQVGKGLRTTYIAFDLVTEGQDFDFDSLEFIPMVSGRRV